MDAPNKIYVEVCEDGIFAFQEPPFKESVEYIRADLVGQSLQPEEPDKSLEEAAQQYAEGPECTWVGTTALEEAFIAGAKRQKQHDAELIEIAYNDGITIGMTKQKEQMMKDAVEGRIGDGGLHNAIFIKEPEWAESLDRLNKGDKVKIIIVKED